MPKRSSVTAERLSQLTQKNARYIISCNQNDFGCKDHPNQKCRRGFFSLFLQVLYGIGFAQKYETPYYVDLSNYVYAYSSPQDSRKRNNFWESLFNQPLLKSSDKLILNQQIEVFPLRIWDRNHYRFLNEIMKKGLDFNEVLTKEINEIKNRMSEVKTLGVHIRKTDHFREFPPAGNAKFFRKIKKKFSTYDKIFVATDDQQLLEKLKKEFSPKIMAHDFVRSQGAISIHNNETLKDGPRLAKEALLDCISLSCCNELILSPSNLSYAALVFNPELKYSIVESGAAKRSRIKTLTSYHLDRLGLRKW
ncbi:hypothetical protein [uncultured Cyclobacterium sp.]|uniref:hypothetical protein n=1 Tax=uncultured Cyclobacterium sp. TaxID=453820 RepID=UPI0030EC1003|tara:strand:+ start:1499 stop:2419 length:921 start_codon:yes stop_codon:yes gene_type:complete